MTLQLDTDIVPRYIFDDDEHVIECGISNNL